MKGIYHVVGRDVKHANYTLSSYYDYLCEAMEYIAAHTWHNVKVEFIDGEDVRTVFHM